MVLAPISRTRKLAAHAFLGEKSPLPAHDSLRHLSRSRMETTLHVGRGLLGIVAFIGIAALFSTNRRRIPWAVVGTGLALQLILAVLILKVDAIRLVFDAVGTFFVKLLSFTNEGSSLVFGWLFNIPTGDRGLIVAATTGSGATASFNTFPPVFAISILPTIIFFAALTSLLYRLGILQVIVYGFAWIMSKTLKLSGAETLSASANIFVGQTEAPLLIKPFIARMTRSELLAIMVGGMATIAGGVMAVYITLLGGSDPAEQVRFMTLLRPLR